MFNPRRWERFSPQAVYKKEISARIHGMRAVDTVCFSCVTTVIYTYILLRGFYSV